jgi:protein TonB
MFEDSLLESAHLLRTQNRWPAFASVALQATIAATIVAIPLFHPSVLPMASLVSTLTPPKLVKPTPPPIQRTRVEASTSFVPAVQTFSQLPRAVSIIHSIDPTASSDTPPMVGNIGMSGAGNDPFAAIASSTASSPHISIAKKPERVNISQGVSAGLLLAPIQPFYPIIARTTHTEGTVTIHAIISKDGRIESATVISGPALLQVAALVAVRNAHYRPYRLNGEPTEVETTFSINFKMNE